MILDESKIWILIYHDSLRIIRKMLDELENSGWKLAKKKGEAYEVYKSEQKDFMIAHLIDKENNTHMIQIEKKDSRQ